MKLEPELRAEFMAEAGANHQPASQVVRELMREYVRQARERRAYGDFVQSKVDAARVSVNRGLGRANAAVEADYAARRARIADQA